ncbi:MmgE/PrpD family protein [Rhizobium sp. R693]|uniref:MmgE/PrpD family protein n=1 Tax=Rhizobium sp. R693 TaxID=1764276 RepID=UPI000B533D4D|nr:MmgE/PrpD family protein [Rhizobium sp. R693]OWV98746.1 2-methylcitrate dehydratase [Rhizobium sp. R693]
MPNAAPIGAQALPHVDALVEFCARLAPADLPERIMVRTKTHLLDTLGAALAGTRSVEFRNIRALAHGGQTPVLGSSIRTSQRDAALVNGVAAHAFELDDSGGCDHTGAVVLPALLAALPSCTAPVSGGEFLCALTVGYEVGRRVLDASGGYGAHNGAGWHSTGTCGTLAAAAAVSRLRGYDKARLRHAMTLATSFSSGLWAFNHDGSQAKKVHAGRAAEGGLLAADLAAEGFSGPSLVFDDVWGGFFRTYVRDSGLPEEFSAGLGTDWKIERASLKPYAACRGAHSAIDAVNDILAQTGRSAADVTKIDLRLSLFLMDMCGRARLETLAGAQMSLGYALASLMVFGRVDLEQYSATARADLRVEDALSRISFHPDPDVPQMAEPEVTVGFRGGDRRTGMVPRATGSSDRPMTDAAIRAKFDTLASMALPTRQAGEIAGLVEALERRGDCRNLPELLASAESERPVFS